MSQLIPRKEQIKSVSDLLMSPGMQRQLALALPKHVTPERLARLALTQVQRVPELLACSRESLLGALMEAAQLGLEPGVAGQCWILPYKKKAIFVCGYRGLAQLAWRTPIVSGLAARPVFEGDHFAYDYGADKLEHQAGDETDPTKLIYAYAILHTTRGGRVWDVMRRKEIEAVRARSASAGSTHSPWLTDYVEMAKKTVFKRMMKLAPMSVEVTRAIDTDDAAERGEDQGIDFTIGDEIDVTPSNPGEPEHPEQGELV